MSTRSKKRKATVEDDISTVEITPEAMQAMYDGVNQDYHRLLAEAKELCRRFQHGGQGSIIKQLLVSDPPLLTINAVYDGEILANKFGDPNVNAKRKLCMETPSPAKAGKTKSLASCLS